MNAPETIFAPDRTTYLGGSDVAAILGVSPWISPFMLYQKKIGAFVEDVTPAKQKILDRGHRWEPIVVEMVMAKCLNGEWIMSGEKTALACEKAQEVKL